MLYEVLFFDVGACDTLAATPLFSVARNGQPFYVAGVAYRDDDVLFGDQVLYI